MEAKINLLFISMFAILLAAHAGTWDSFEIGQTCPGDYSKCFNLKYNMEMLIGSEYQVPNTCATMMCHDSYVISERILEVGQEYDPVCACGKITCDADANMTVQACPEIKFDDSCSSTSEDLTKTYPDCCPQKVCATSRSLVSQKPLNFSSPIE